MCVCVLLAPSKSVVDEIEDKKVILSKLYDYSKQGIRVRSRTEWFENGENNIQYFEQLLKSNKKKTVIRELYDKESKIIRDKNEILKIIKVYYEKLYSENKRNIDGASSLFNNIPRLSDESRELCEGKV